MPTVSCNVNHIPPTPTVSLRQNVISITVAVSAGDSSQMFFTPADNWQFLMNIILMTNLARFSVPSA